jgi:hypothetical protein
MSFSKKVDGTCVCLARLAGFRNHCDVVFAWIEKRYLKSTLVFCAPQKRRILLSDGFILSVEKDYDCKLGTRGINTSLTPFLPPHYILLRRLSCTKMSTTTPNVCVPKVPELFAMSSCFAPATSANQLWPKRIHHLS